MTSTGGFPLLLTNYRGSGIGDFGSSLIAHLTLQLPQLEIEETSLSGSGSVRQFVRSAGHRGQLIVNIGLTAWGKSGLRNFLGFGAVGLHRFTGYPTKVIVHHAIEVFDPRETGYALSRTTFKGAHLALRLLRECDVTVFSPRMRDILSQQYGARNIRLVPLPGERTRRLATSPLVGRGRVITVGYWAPYKGINLYLQVASHLRARAQFTLAGRPHLALSSDRSFRHQVEEWTARAAGAGVRVLGFLSPSQLDAEVSGPTIGVLPYTSVSGASAAFQMFAERGVPVVATDLPEFRYLKDLGAGILLSPATALGVSGTIEYLLDNPRKWLELAERQEQFNTRYSWSSFVDSLLM